MNQLAPNDFEKRILVLEEDALEFEEHAAGLSSAGVPFERFGSVDELLDELSSIDIKTVGGFSLDLRIPAPGRARAVGAARGLGGRWFYDQVLHNTDEEFFQGNEEQILALQRKPVGFLTNYPDDKQLIELVEDMAENNVDIPVYDKDQLRLDAYVNWAKSAIELDRINDDYSAAALTASRLCEAMGFTSKETIMALGGSEYYRMVMTADVEDVWKLIVTKFPADRCFSAMDMVDRWSIISALVGDAISVFSNDIAAVQRDFDTKLAEFGDKSMKEVLLTGRTSELSMLYQFSEYRWGKM